MKDSKVFQETPRSLSLTDLEAKSDLVVCDVEVAKGDRRSPQRRRTRASLPGRRSMM